MPTVCVIWSVRISWSTMSKTALRSNKTKIEHSSESAVNSKSFDTLRRADSVLWRALKPDWNFSKMLEMGRKFFRMVAWLEWSRLGLLNRHWTTAFLKQDGTMPEIREWFIRMLDLLYLNTILRRCERIVSREQVVGFIWDTVSIRTERETEDNSVHIITGRIMHRRLNLSSNIINLWNWFVLSFSIIPA